MTVNVKTNNNTKTLVEPANVSNPNLLINPDFKINQRLQSSYSSKDAHTIPIVYTVDRWYVYGHSVTVNSDKTITITPSEYSEGAFIQILENNVSGPVVLNVCVKDISGTVTVSIRDIDANTKTLGTLKTGENIFKSNNGCARVIIRCSSGASATLKWVKLEKGTVATLFIEPDRATEMLKCQRFFQRTYLMATFYGVQDQTYRIPINIPVNMRIEPTFKKDIKYAFNIKNSDGSIVSKSQSYVQYYFYLQAQVSLSCSFECNLQIDAEIY